MSRAGRGLAAVAALLVAATAGCGVDRRPVRAVVEQRVPEPNRRAATTTATTVPARDLVAEACSGSLAAIPGVPIDDPALVEVSGVAVVGPAAGAGPATTWVLNDSGDQPRLYGIGADGRVRTVSVTGAEAVDWEDLAVQTGPEPVLWIADTGGNVAPRDRVQLYRVPVPASGATSVAATRVEVLYPDGPHDVEGVLVTPAGIAYLLAKEPGRARIYEVPLPASGEAGVAGDPGASAGPVLARGVGSLRAGSGIASVVTGAALAPDGSAVAIRSYGRVWLQPVAPGQDLPSALADEARRCGAPAGAELQGEAVAFLPDGSGYVTIGEGASPVITTIAPAG